MRLHAGRDDAGATAPDWCAGYAVRGPCSLLRPGNPHGSCRADTSPPSRSGRLLSRSARTGLSPDSAGSRSIQNCARADSVELPARMSTTNPENASRSREPSGDGSAARRCSARLALAADEAANKCARCAESRRTCPLCLRRRCGMPGHWRTKEAKRSRAPHRSWGFPLSAYRRWSRRKPAPCQQKAGRASLAPTLAHKPPAPLFTRLQAGLNRRAAPLRPIRSHRAIDNNRSH
jgi:hypothetical protein